MRIWVSLQVKKDLSYLILKILIDGIVISAGRWQKSRHWSSIISMGTGTTIVCQTRWCYAVIVMGEHKTLEERTKEAATIYSYIQLYLVISSYYYSLRYIKRYIQYIVVITRTSIRLTLDYIQSPPIYGDRLSLTSKSGNPLTKIIRGCIYRARPAKIIRRRL